MMGSDKTRAPSQETMTSPCEQLVACASEASCAAFETVSSTTAGEQAGGAAAVPSCCAAARPAAATTAAADRATARRAIALQLLLLLRLLLLLALLQDCRGRGLVTLARLLLPLSLSLPRGITPSLLPSTSTVEPAAGKSSGHGSGGDILAELLSDWSVPDGKHEKRKTGRDETGGGRGGWCSPTTVAWLTLILSASLICDNNWHIFAEIAAGRGARLGFY